MKNVLMTSIPAEATHS